MTCPPTDRHFLSVYCHLLPGQPPSGLPAPCLVFWYFPSSTAVQPEWFFKKVHLSLSSPWHQPFQWLPVTVRTKFKPFTQFSCLCTIWLLPACLTSCHFLPDSLCSRHTEPSPSVPSTFCALSLTSWLSFTSSFFACYYGYLASGLALDITSSGKPPTSQIWVWDLLLCSNLVCPRSVDLTGLSSLLVWLGPGSILDSDKEWMDLVCFKYPYKNIDSLNRWVIMSSYLFYRYQQVSAWPWLGFARRRSEDRVVSSCEGWGGEYGIRS